MFARFYIPFAWALLLVFASAVCAQAGGNYNMSWNTIAGGGQTFGAGGNYVIGSTIGQTGAGTQVMAGGNYIVKGGFWVTAAKIIIPADLDKDDDVDQFDFDLFQLCASGPSIAGPLATECSPSLFYTADFDGDYDVDSDDFATFQRCWTGEDNPTDPNCAN